MKRSYRHSLLALALASCWGVQAIADTEPTLAPLNADFSQSTLTERSSEASGYVTSPVERTQMTGLTPESVVIEAPTAFYPPSLDLRTLGAVVAVQNQGGCNDGWSFAAAASLESNALLNGVIYKGPTVDEQSTEHGFDLAACAGGNFDIASAYLSTNFQATVLALPDRADGTDNDNYKYAINNYGAVAVALYADGGMFNGVDSAAWNQATSAYYYSGDTAPNHAVTLIGWDDSYSASNFSTVAPGNGAFIAQNQWDTSWGNSGYFHISYYDAQLSDAHSFLQTNNSDAETRTYAYDEFGQTGALGYDSNSAWGANVYTADDDETLQSVGLYTTAVNTSYEVYIYTGVTDVPSSGTLEGGAVNTVGTADFAGHQVVTLDRAVELTAGDNFAVVVKFSNEDYNYPVPVEYPIAGYNGAATAAAGQSYVSADGVTWTDATDTVADSNVGVRAFTEMAAPTATTNNPSNITPNSATLNGKVNAGGASVIVKFQYIDDDKFDVDPVGYYTKEAALKAGVTTNVVTTPDGSIASGSTDTTVALNIAGLVAETIYHYRVAVTASDVFGDDKEFTTLEAGPPDITNVAADTISAVGARLKGTVNAYGSDTTDIHFEYGLTDSYEKDDNLATTPGQVDANAGPIRVVSATLDSLTCGETYHYRLVAANDFDNDVNNIDNITEGTDKQFTLLDCAKPSATTEAADDIDATTATLNALISANGFDTSVIFDYGTTANYGSTLNAGPVAADGVDEEVSADLESLKCATKYYYRVRASNELGSTEADGLTFTTDACKPLTVTTDAADDIGFLQATLNATVVEGTETAVVSFQYGPTTSYGTTVADEDDPSKYSAEITGLACGITYHFRAKVLGSISGTVYGEDVSFTTDQCVAPQVSNPSTSTTAANANILNRVVLNATVDSNGGASTTASFEYGPEVDSGAQTYPNTIAAVPALFPATDDGAPGTTPEDGAITATVDGLACSAAGITYHYRAKVKNKVGTNYTDDGTFDITCGAPFATTEEATDISYTKATLNAKVSANGGETVARFLYGLDSTTLALTSDDIDAVPNTVDPTGVKVDVTATLTGLECETTYQYSAHVESSFEENNPLDDIITFDTLDCADPIVTTKVATGVSADSATLNAEVDDRGNNITVSFVYRNVTDDGDEKPVSGNPNTLDAETGATAVTLNLAEVLLCGKKYEYWATVAVSNVDNVVPPGNTINFTTDDCPVITAPIVTTKDATVTSGTTVTLKGEVDDGGATTTVYFDYFSSDGLNAATVLAGSVDAGAGKTTVTADVTGLVCETEYQYIVRAENKIGPNEGENVTFTTGTCPPAAPTAETTAPSGIKVDQATMNGKVDSNNAATTVSFEYGTTTGSYSETVDATPKTIGATAAVTLVNATLNGLDCGTTYYYRLKAVNSIDTSYGEEFEFTTDACVIVAPTVTVSDATDVTADGATLNGTVDSGGASTTVTFEYGTDETYGSTADGGTVAADNRNATVSAAITDLTCGTTYYYKIVAANSVDTTTSNPGGTFNTTACPKLCGDVDDSGAVDIVDALKIAKFEVKLTENVPTCLAAGTCGDVNNDNKINISDALQIAKFVVKLSTAGTCLPQP